LVSKTDLLIRGIEMGNRKSLRQLWPLLVIMLAACAATGTNPSSASSEAKDPFGPGVAIPDAEVAAQANQAEVDGKKLFDAYTSVTAGKAAEITAARAAVTDYCGHLDYKAVEVDGARPGQDFIYLIATTDEPDVIVWGRHYRVTLDEASGKVISVAPSTYSCAAISLSPKGLPAGATLVSPSITHLLSPAPSEFHVFLSLEFPKPLSVMSSYGIWIVEKGKIRLLEKHEVK
jgi:hypothetical protein